MMDEVDNDETGEIERALGIGEIDLAALPRSTAGPDALAERKRAVAINDVAASAKRIGIAVDINRALELAVEPRALRAAVLEAAAARDEATAVVSAAPPPNMAAGPATARTSPIVALARERAEAAERKRGNRC